MMSDADMRRFWSKVSLPGESGCMPWLGGQDACGYGRFYSNREPLKAHRLALALASGPPPFPDAVAAHLPVVCHNPLCVAPDHLRWTTQADNIRDRVADGTHNRGERCGTAKLTAGQVKAIRDVYAAGGSTHRSLGRQYGIGYGTVGKIVRGERWQHA
jgi:hypothetical protein